jgi:spermidine/putrescine transport system substrate-binding protein
VSEHPEGDTPRELGSLEVDPALFRGLTGRRTSRRGFLSAGAGAAGALGLAPFLAACGVAGTKANSKKAAEFDWTAWWQKQKPTNQLIFANWPYYIDTSNNGKDHPSLDMFTKATGINVQYKEVIQNNAPFYAQIAPVLQAGQATGYDIIVITNGWQLTQLLENAWIIPVWMDKVPNFQKYASASVKDPTYNPQSKYGLVWQSGFTGIGYNPKLTGREITSIDDLWDPKFKGHIGMMSDNTELGSVALLKNGVNPPDSTQADWNKARDILNQQKPLVRQYYDQSYIDALQNGDIWISQAWSGDIYQANLKGYKDLKFVIPDQGVMYWHDNMLIPLHAANPLSALSWMNFYYTPKIAGIVADWVNYITPVPGAQKYVADVIKDPAVAHSPLVFPTEADYSKAHDYYTFKNYSDFSKWNATFNPIIQS